MLLGHSLTFCEHSNKRIAITSKAGDHLLSRHCKLFLGEQKVLHPAVKKETIYVSLDMFLPLSEPSGQAQTETYLESLWDPT